MKLIAGEVVAVEVDGNKLTVKIEDASKGDIVSGRVQNVMQGDTYSVGQICDFNRNDLKEA